MTYNQMYEDVPTSNIPNKVRVIELVNENVIVPTQIKIQKGQFLLPFFLLYLHYFLLFMKIFRCNVS